MNYPFILKFSSITNLSDARYAAGVWADFIGFCFDPSRPEYMEPSKAKEITGWVNGPLITGEFGDQPIEWIGDFVRALSLRAIQVPASYQDKNIVSLGLKLIVEVDEPSRTWLMEKADLFITGKKEVHDFLKQHFEQPVIRIIEIPDVNAADYDGIAFNGKMEDKPGTRNHGMWNDILEPYMG